MILLEGVAADQSGQLKEQLGGQDAFTISDPPSASSNKHLMALFQSLGVASSHQCELAATINPFERDCWTGPALVVKYDLRSVCQPPPPSPHIPFKRDHIPNI